MPAGAALGVFPLAKEFGWSMDFILWDLPLVILHQAIGWSAWRNGLKIKRAKKASVMHADIAKKIGL